MILSNITSSLEMHELKEETFTVQKKLDIIGTQGRNLVELYSKVTGMTKQACTCDEIVRKQFYDFTFHNLKAVHKDLNARVADLQSGDTNMTKEENEKLQTLLADQREREKQVERLEEVRALLRLPTEEKLRISQYATPERRNTEPSIPAQMQRTHSEATLPNKTVELKWTNTRSRFRSKGKSNENMYSLVSFSKKALEDS
ncbi:uncharacterized protein LOC111331826 [Stylophora pistillata]|uniref:uncharacterized protein LOC111331826 n=1 Tax=Stylophora pistillata TaxID=50429 RepID=UPI000C0496BF|nr:uncharacterized protein LOC111331826 [Stylophora pistillata]XP_022792753.1 uncharacterized protein LOC111331826 [Stylophora pistillata]